jgi:hypothetical protein
MRTDGYDKALIAFHNFMNAPKNELSYFKHKCLGLLISILAQAPCRSKKKSAQSSVVVWGIRVDWLAYKCNLHGGVKL